MNDKASVSKELNAKHTKILEGLLKLPQNRECADCRNKGPRWASVNLGAFICMQCSGIHRSLGVHISKLGKRTPEVYTCMKILGTSLSFYIFWRNFWTQNFMVRSATLDTWLPEQVAFMESMGNEKANSYWEANLPPNCDRRDIANFIRAKYEERRWVANNTAQPMRSPDEICGTFNAVKKEGSAPRRTRNLSLDEEVLTKHVAQVAFPVAKARGGSVDMTNMIVTSPPPNFPQQKVESHASRNSLSGSLDLFNLPCIHDVKKDCSSVTPPNWATFDCKIFIKMLRIKCARSKKVKFNGETALGVMGTREKKVH